ncbi:S-layer homology domain-containing protein [Pseudomonadota bacterium]
MKKLIALTVGLGLVLTFTVIQIALASFPDVTESTDYQDSITWMNENGVIQGYPDGTFKPENCVNRVEMLKLLFEMLEVDASTYSAELFSDTEEGQWYTEYIEAGRARGTIEGYPDGTFKPAQCVNRVEAIKMAILEFNDGEIPGEPIGYMSAEGITDLVESEWYYDYTSYAFAAELLGIEHTGGDLHLTNYFPAGEMSRAEVSEMLYRMKTIQDNGAEAYNSGLSPSTIEPNEDITFTGNTLLSNNDFMTQSMKDSVVTDWKIMYEWSETTWTDMDDFFRWYDVGRINAEPYKGDRLILLDLRCDGMCFQNFVYRFAYNESTKELVMLDNHSNDYKAEYLGVIDDNIDTTTFLEGINLPETIAVPETSEQINLINVDAMRLDEHDFDVAFIDPELGNIYFYDDGENIGCLFAVTPDGYMSTYNYDTKIFGETIDEVVTIEFNDGSESTESFNYMHTHVGCGVMGSCYFVKNVNVNGLEHIATTSRGAKLYQVEVPIEGLDEGGIGGSVAQLELAQLYEMYSSMYQFTREDNPETPMTFEEFLEIHPLLYWQDALGRWASIGHSITTGPGECGKPVIYLYPEETVDVHVEVDIDEFTVTIPDYGTNGWTVQAQPDGTLYNYADEKEYPYLFWEGHKNERTGVDQGFMIQRDELEDFLNDSLPKMGLNETESADFMEFWLERMLDNKQEYFFINFMGTRDFNKVAPLSISPEPDTLIRVFMYYRPVDEPYYVREQNLTSIPRCGFTVIEWGGTASVPWRR